MRKVLKIMYVLLFVLNAVVNAQERSIEGVVTDTDGNPLEGVMVEAEGTQLSVKTNERGYYRLEALADSIQTLRFSHPDMEDASASIGIYTTVDVKMGRIGTEFMSDYSLEDLLNMEVITASKKAEKGTDAPGVIHTITREEIKQFGANNLSDVLERAPSIQRIGSHLFPNNLTVIRGDLRTHYDNHVLILVDGKPVRDGILGGINSPFYLGFPLELIERIEIIRGPGSVLYGTNAFTGVINIITQDNNKNALDANFTAGSFGTFGGSLTGSVSKSDLKASIGAKLDNISGWEYSAMTVRPGAENLLFTTDYGRRNLGLVSEISYKGLSLFGFYTYENQDMLGILPYPTFAGNNKLSRLMVNLGYNHHFGESWEASVNLTYSSSDMKIGDEAVTPFDHQESTDYLAEVTINGQLMKDLNLVVGGVLDSRNKNNISDNDAIPLTYNQIHLSAYAQADYRPVKFLKLIAGAQLNKPDVGSVDLVPRFGAIMNFSDNFGAKALYASAFRSPWPIEQLLSNPTIVGNPDLGPEKISTLDIQLFYSSKKATGSLTYYNSNYSNSISRAPLSDTSAVFTYINQGELHMNGFEIEGKVTVSSYLFITGSATIQNNPDEETVPVYIPKFMGKMGLLYKTNFGLTLGVYNTYFGKPKENSGEVLNPEATAMNLLSFNINYKPPISIPVELTVFAQNLLNIPYYYTEFGRLWVNTLPMQPGLAIYGKIAVRL